MASKIHILSEQEINRIAAGEVIENPASVVKELVENALDAGATRILIEIKEGGQQLIRIVDNGSGMHAEDALLSLQRYATSKIRSVEDLWKLTTLGFRGEALASIAAISKLTLMTSDGEGLSATQIEVEAGEVLSIGACARARGTTIEVRSLFYNVPARKKFQKSTGVNASEITRLITALSLAHPHVSFTLMHQEREVFTTSEAGYNDFDAQLHHRIGDILQEEFAESPFKIFFEEGGIRLQGKVAAPAQSRPQRTGQYLYINGRFVNSPAIAYAVKEAYGTRIAENRHPVFVLHLQLPPFLLDVNVHPQKKEVRLSEEKYLKNKIMEAVSQALQGIPEQNEPLPFLTDPLPYFEEKTLWKEEFPPLRFKEEDGENSFLLPLPVPESKVIGLFKDYLLLEGESIANRVAGVKEGIALIDLRAAAARIAFDALVAQQQNRDIQGLLIPLKLEFSLSEAQMIEENLQEIEKIGFSLHAIGEKLFLIDALPSFLDAADVRKIILEMIAEARIGSAKGDKHRKFATIAARFAAYRKNKFTIEESLILFEKLLISSSPYHCPRGNPTIACVSVHEIAKYFN